MMIVGIVGGIGSGKSLVASALVERGGVLIAADALGHEALCQPDIKERVVDRFGKSILDAQGQIQRRVLGRLVFADAKELRALEELVFPWIGQRIIEEIARARQGASARMIVLDAAIMMEAGWDKNCDRVIFVDASEEVRRRRLLDKRGWSAREVLEREASQLPVAEKRRRADAIVENMGTPAMLAEQIDRLLREWKIV